MAGRFSYSKPNRRGPNDPWFRVGTIDIGSAALLGLLCVVSVFVYAIDKPILQQAGADSRRGTSGQVWRIVTWPLANGFDRQLLWVIVSIAMLWYFGSRLEAQVGRVTIRLVPGDDHRHSRARRHGSRPPTGRRAHRCNWSCCCTFIAEYPNVRFFFGIPAWVLGVVYVAAEVLQLTGDRAGRATCCSSSSRSSSALSPRAPSACSRPIPWIPKISRATSAHASRRRSRRPAVVAGPWGGTHLGLGRPERARRSARQDQRDAGWTH